MVPVRDGSDVTRKHSDSDTDTNAVGNEDGVGRIDTQIGRSSRLRVHCNGGGGGQVHVIDRNRSRIENRVTA